MNKSYNKVRFNKILNKYNNIFPISKINICKAYKYNKPLGRYIYNYKNCDNYQKTNCECDKYENYIAKEHGHIITGDMNFVSSITGNEKLKELMNKGTKFRITANCKNFTVKKQINKDVDNFIYRIAIKYGQPLEAFAEWKFRVLKDLHNHSFNSENSIKLREIKDGIELLQKQYIITYIDKVENNFAIICKKYYKEVLRNYIGSNVNYEKVKYSNKEINNRLTAKHKLVDLNINKVIFPYMFLTPKFHKNPIKFRTVTCGYNTYINKTGKILQKIIQKIIDNMKDTFIISNSYDVIKNMRNFGEHISTVSTYDFEDLFNNIGIKDIDLVFNWLYNNYDECKIYEYDKFIAIKNIVVYENYITMNGHLYRQINGIPQGAPCSNAIANVFLHYFESEYSKTVCNNSVIFRYIDDLLIFGEDSGDSKLLKCYPSYLTLKLTNYNKLKANFLDITIELDSCNIHTKLYDKTKDYGFYINKLQDWNSNLSIEVFRNIIVNFLNRNNNLCSKEYDKIFNIDEFINIALKLDYPLDFIYNYLIKNNKQTNFKLLDNLNHGVSAHENNF